MNQRENPALIEKAQGDLGFFDRLSESVTAFAAQPLLFVGITLFITLWIVQGVVVAFWRGPSYFLDSQYQLEVNSPTTVITTLLALLILNSQRRGENAIQFKLNAQADALADFMEFTAEGLDDPRRSRLCDHAEQLRTAVGIEKQISA